MVTYQFVKETQILDTGLITARDLAQAALDGTIRIISTPDGQYYDGVELESKLGLVHPLWCRKDL